MTEFIDLNADLGESEDDYIPLLPIVSSANVACGGHAGGGELLIKTVKAAVSHGVQIGAHPSYQDRENFGRRSLRGLMSEDELVTKLKEQISLVADELSKHNRVMSHIKAHGALYNDAMVHQDIALLLVKTANEFAPGIPLLGLPNSVLEEECKKAGVGFIREGYADRAYTSLGTLVPRSESGSVLGHEEAVEQVIRMITTKSVFSKDGTVIPMDVATICIHADTPDAAVTAKNLKEELENLGIHIKPFTFGPSQ